MPTAQGTPHYRLLLTGTLAVLGLVLMSSAAKGACPNEQFRVGPSQHLPDCRAYELITPPNSNGRAFSTIESALPFDLFATELLSPVRDSVLYMTLGSPLLEPHEPNGTYDLYEANRSASGWQTNRRLSPAGWQAVFPNAGGVSADHLYAFTQVGPVEQTRDGGALAENGDSDYLGQPDGSFELVGVGQLGTERLAQGRFISSGGEHVIFTTGGEWCSFAGSECQIKQLEPNAPPTGTPAIYDRAADGQTHVVSLLPNNLPPAAGEVAEYQGVAADGSTVAFKIGGTLYVRVDNAVTKLVTAAPTTFAGISRQGEFLFYVKSGDVYRFDVAGGTTDQISASGDAQIVNVSADGTHVYFVSPSLLDGSEGTAGEPNLYVWAEGGAPEFVATLSQSDVEGVPSLITWTSWVVTPDKNLGQGPGADPSRTTPNGEVLVFESRARLTDYDTAGHNQIYRYDHLTQAIRCISCNSLIAASAADARLEAYNVLDAPVVVHNLSQDGTRVFFETPESLVERDVNDINDIYQWHQPSPDADPAVDLISSGRSPAYPGVIEPQQPNVIFGIDPQGTDVVFLAVEPLVPGAGIGGASALYDARIFGGFASPPSPLSCIGEPCRGGAMAGEAPSLTSPSPAPAGSRNVKPRKRCHRRVGKARAGRKARHCRRKQSKSRNRQLVQLPQEALR